jgi:hypothetical protein
VHEDNREKVKAILYRAVAAYSAGQASAGPMFWESLSLKKL